MVVSGAPRTGLGGRRLIREFKTKCPVSMGENIGRPNIFAFENEFFQGALSRHLDTDPALKNAFAQLLSSKIDFELDWTCLETLCRATEWPDFIAHYFKTFGSKYPQLEINLQTLSWDIGPDSPGTRVRYSISTATRNFESTASTTYLGRLDKQSDGFYLPQSLNIAEIHNLMVMPSDGLACFDLGQFPTVAETVLRETLPGAWELLERQRGITGFVTVAGLESDPRSAVFGRFHHIDRVVQIAIWQAEMLRDQGEEIDFAKVVRLAALHDINRLPFAHNAEGAVGFKQAANIRPYLERHNLLLEEYEIRDFEAILAKDVEAMSREARIAFAADTVDGYIEDPLLAITALGVRSEFVPGEVAERLGLPFNNPAFQDRLNNLRALYEGRKPAQYTAEFNLLVYELATQFLTANNEGNKLFIEIEGYGVIKNMLREGFMNKQVFPINNKVASQQDALKHCVVIPLFKQLEKQLGSKEAAHFQMLQWTDQKALDEAVERGIIENASDYYPLLDNLEAKARKQGLIK